MPNELQSKVATAVETARFRDGAVEVDRIAREVADLYGQKAGGVEAMIARLVLMRCKQQGIAMRLGPWRI